MKSFYWTVCIFASIVLVWKIGYDTGKNESINYCPAVQGEKLAYSTQTLHGTDCVYIKDTRGLRKSLRRV